MQESRAAAAPPPAGRVPVARYALFALGAVVAVAAIALLGKQASSYVFRFAEWVNGLGFWGPAVFMLGYTVAAVAFIPGSVLTLGAGVIFGLATGTLYVFIAASAAACLAFLIARNFARGAVEKRLGGNAAFARLDRAIAREGRKIVFLLRLAPAFPFTYMNYALGLTSVRFGDYAVACFGMLPGTLMYVYLGSLIGDLAAIGAGEGAGDTGQYVKLGGFVATVVVTVLVTRVARRALAEASEDDASLAQETQA